MIPISVFLDFLTKKIIYIYPSRRKDRLSSEISFIPKFEHLNVKYVVIDMWDTYRDLAIIYFPNCKVVFDSFHVIRHLNDAMDSIRIKIMKTKWTKHEIRKYLFSIDEDLKNAYFLKERYREFNLTADYEKCGEELELFIDEFLNSKHEEFRTFGKLLIHWKVEIKKLLH